MLPELHLAEKAFALHLLLQRPEGLIDIVVTDENLHVVRSSLIRRLIGPTAKAPGPLADGYAANAALYPDSKVSIRTSLYSIRSFIGNEKATPKNKPSS
jgi:hypothetical protein